MVENEKFRDFDGPAPLCAILSALDYIIAQIHPAEAQVCANCVFLRKETLLETFIYLVRSFTPFRTLFLASLAKGGEERALRAKGGFVLVSSRVVCTGRGVSLLRRRSRLANVIYNMSLTRLTLCVARRDWRYAQQDAIGAMRNNRYSVPYAIPSLRSLRLSEQSERMEKSLSRKNINRFLRSASLWSK